MTPHELDLHANDYLDRQKRENEEQLTLTWLGVYWNRIDHKKFPKLKDVIGSKDKPKEQTPEAMLAEIKRLNAVFEGTTN